MRATLIERMPEADEFDREQAIYWFANDHHGGQWSELYAALCASEYQPGAIERCPDGSGEDCYAALVEEFGQ
jgi:hypothetical protein